jgi:hypothetical protein
VLPHVFHSIMIFIIFIIPLLNEWKQIASKIPEFSRTYEKNIPPKICVSINIGENNNNTARMLPPRTPNYGKTPKYINKYKEEQKQAE